MYLFNTTASTALGSLPTIYCDEIFSSVSVDLGYNKSYHQLVTEYGYFHQFSHGQSDALANINLPSPFPPVYQHPPHLSLLAIRYLIIQRKIVYLII